MLGLCVLHNIRYQSIINETFAGDIFNTETLLDFCSKTEWLVMEKKDVLLYHSLNSETHTEVRA